MDTFENTGLHSTEQVHWMLKDGVSASTIVLPSRQALAAEPAGLLSFLEQTFQSGQGLDWLGRFKNGLILNEQGQALPYDAPFISGQRIYYWRDAGVEPRIPFDEQIVYQDAHILVADKPHYLPVTPTGRYVQETLLVRLRKRTGLAELAPIHRIDRDTAGLVLFSVKASERGAYMRLFRERQVEKVYECIAPYKADLTFPQLRKTRLEDSPASFMQMVEMPGEPNSETLIECMGVLEAQHDGPQDAQPLARYRLKPLTGKRHQLRVHMNALGLPICGDGIYPVLQPEPALNALRYDAPLQLLAKQLSFTDPLTQKKHDFLSTKNLDWSGRNKDF
jgi:tRNA pseudouridine32 synthase / 23S rRNA pseudouridine746 synthase